MTGPNKFDFLSNGTMYMMNLLILIVLNGSVGRLVSYSLTKKENDIKDILSSSD